MSTRDQRITQLRTMFGMHGAAPDAVARVARTVEPRHGDAGAVIIAEAQPGHEFFMITDGLATVTRGGRRVAVLGPGDFFGEMALLEGRPRSATVTAVTDLELLVMARGHFEALLHHGAFRKMLMRGMARRLHELDASEDRTLRASSV